MKRIILTTLIAAGLMVSNVNAYMEDIKYNSNEYIFKINDYIGELNCNLDKNETSLFKGLRAGYIEPELENLKELKICVSGLSDNIRSYKIDNNELQNLHNEFVAELDDLVKNLDKSINNKIEILENYNCVSAFVKLITYDDTKTSEINENIDKINKLYKDINSFYTK
jgi:hypothetical protein